jgi:two-component system chemotaxis sensor kinase CheA
LQQNAIEYIRGCSIYRLRGQLLQLAYLQNELMLGERDPDTLNIVLLQANKCHFGLVVDEINDTQEIVVKPLAEPLKSISVFAGATITGDGWVVLILDTQGNGHRASVMGNNLESAVISNVADGNEKSGLSETLLLVSTAVEGMLAILLNRVSRLEQFEISQTELAGNNQVVQYRGQILPLVELLSY